MGVSGENLKCGISRKMLIIERNGRKFGTQGTTVRTCICRVLLMLDSMSLIWGHLVHTVNFRFYDFRNTPSRVFIRIQPSFMQSIIIRGFTFLGELPKIKNFMALWIFVSTGPCIWGWKFQNATPRTVSIRCQPNFMRTLASMVEYRLLLVLTIDQFLKILWHFEILTWKSMGKPKMWNIPKTVDRSVKRTKVWESWYYNAYTCM